MRQEDIMGAFVQSFVGQGRGVRDAVDQATQKTNAWVAEHGGAETTVVALASQTFTTEGAQWFHVITVALTPR